MAASAYALPAPLVGTPAPQLWNPTVRRSLYGDAVVVAFLLAQCFDGVFTYVGVLTFGLAIEANPIIAALIASFGSGPALAGAKVVAATLGICLHLREVHGAVAFLTAFYLTVAIIPWTAILFF